MRMLVIAAVALAGLAGGAAQAQTQMSQTSMGTGGPAMHGPPPQGPGWSGHHDMPGPDMRRPDMPRPDMNRPDMNHHDMGHRDMSRRDMGGHDMGRHDGGRWMAGNRAPGGWNAYRRPQRGWQMPHYWRAPDYRIGNFALFGLAPPPPGYGWTRYYDDAVLVDDDGRVYDSVSGVDWGGYGDGYAYAGDGYAYAQSGAQYGYGYQGGYIPGASATATVEFDRGGPETTTTTTTTTTTEWTTEPVVTYVPVRERVVYRQGPTRVVYRTIVKRVPVYRAPVKKWRPARRAPRCKDACECGKVCGS